MSTIDKLLQRIEKLDTGLRFSEIARVLKLYGYQMNQPAGGSSHFTFRKEGRMPITIPKHEPIKKVYVAMVRDVIRGDQQS